jgi:hypothetical protein
VFFSQGPQPLLHVVNPTLPLATFRAKTVVWNVQDDNRKALALLATNGLS